MTQAPPTPLSEYPRVTAAVPEAVIEAITAMQRPVVVAHVVPDADALGAMFATAIAWSEKGRTLSVALPEGSLSKRLAFLFDLARVRIASTEDFASADGYIVVDTAKQTRCNVGPALRDTNWVGDRPVVNIDHHATNTGFGTINWIVDSASSTCEMVYRLLIAADRPINSITASMLYAGIQTDTLGFSLDSVSPAALRAAAHLVELGARVGELGERLGRSLSRGEFELLRIVYANTRITADGRIAYSSAGFDEIARAGCTAADIDEQINVPRSLDGVQLAMLFSEGRKGKTRINFRGSGPVTVVELAAEFGGGGHQQAAGAVIEGGLEDTMARVIPRAVEYIKQFPAESDSV